MHTDMWVLEVDLRRAALHKSKLHVALSGQVLQAEDFDVLLVLERRGPVAQQVGQAGRVGDEEDHHEEPPERHHQPTAKRPRGAYVT